MSILRNGYFQFFVRCMAFLLVPAALISLAELISLDDLLGWQGSEAQRFLQWLGQFMEEGPDHEPVVFLAVLYMIGWMLSYAFLCIVMVVFAGFALIWMMAPLEKADRKKRRGAWHPGME